MHKTPKHGAFQRAMRHLNIMRVSFIEGFVETFRNGTMFICGLVLCLGYSPPEHFDIPIWRSFGLALGAGNLISLYLGLDDDRHVLNTGLLLLGQVIAIPLLNMFHDVDLPRIGITATILAAGGTSFGLMPLIVWLQTKSQHNRSKIL